MLATEEAERTAGPLSPPQLLTPTSGMHSTNGGAQGVSEQLLPPRCSMGQTCYSKTITSCSARPGLPSVEVYFAPLLDVEVTRRLIDPSPVIRAVTSTSCHLSPPALVILLGNNGWFRRGDFVSRLMSSIGARESRGWYGREWRR